MALLSEAGVEAVGGIIGACIAYGLTYPLTTVSTWQALSQKRKARATATATPGEEGDSSQAAEEEEQRRKQREAEQAALGAWKLLPSPLRELVLYSKLRGFGSMWAGISPFLVATAASNGLYFYLYSSIRQAYVLAVQRLAESRRAAAAAAGGGAQPAGPAGAGAASSSTRMADIGALGSLLVASLAGGLNALATHPLWLIAMRQQVAQRSSAAAGADTAADEPRRQQAAPGKSSWALAQELYREEGIPGFWKGVVPALVMVSNPVVQFFLYEWLTARLLDVRRKKLQQLRQQHAKVVLTPGDAFMLSALAKLGATLVTYPMLLVKSRMQTSSSSSRPEEQYHGVAEAVARIVRTEGVGALFKGLKAKLLQTVLGAALLMGIKERLYLSLKTLSAPAAAKAALVATR